MSAVPITDDWCWDMRTRGTGLDDWGLASPVVDLGKNVVTQLQIICSSMYRNQILIHRHYKFKWKSWSSIFFGEFLRLHVHSPKYFLLKSRLEVYAFHFAALNFFRRRRRHRRFLHVLRLCVAQSSRFLLNDPFLWKKMLLMKLVNCIFSWKTSARFLNKCTLISFAFSESVKHPSTLLLLVHPPLVIAISDQQISFQRFFKS